MKTSAVRAARPHLIRAAVAAVIAIAGMVLASLREIDFKDLVKGNDLDFDDWLPMVSGSLLLLIAGIVAVRAAAKAIRVVSGEQFGESRATGLSLLITVAGYLLIAVSLLSTIGVNPAGLLLGGAMAGVVLGIAAQQTLSNFFAGIVLLVNKPFIVGENVVMRAGALGGEFEGLVTDMSLFYVRLQTDNGPVALPNAAVLAAAIGPGARSVKEEEKETEEP